jgi:hypothetical protein
MLDLSRRISSRRLRGGLNLDTVATVPKFRRTSPNRDISKRQDSMEDGWDFVNDLRVAGWVTKGYDEYNNDM